MDYVLRQSSKGANVTRLALVVGVHVLLVIGMVSAINNVRSPIKREFKPIDLVPVIEPAKPIEPVPIVTLRPFTPPETFVPFVPVVLIDSPPPTDAVSVPASTPVTRGTTSDPAGDTPTAPMPAPVATKAVAPVTTGSVGIACPNAAAVQAALSYPKQAQRDGIEGDVIVRFMVDTMGVLSNIHIVSSSNRAFNAPVISAVQRFSCQGQAGDVMVEVPFSFKLN